MINGFKKVSYFNSEDPIAVFVQECNLIVKGIISDKAMLDELKEEFLLLESQLNEFKLNGEPNSYGLFFDFDYEKLIIRSKIKNLENLKNGLVIGDDDNVLELNIDFYHKVHSFGDLVKEINLSLLENRLFNNEFLAVLKKYDKNPNNWEMSVVKSRAKKSYFRIDTKIGLLLCQLSIKKIDCGDSSYPALFLHYLSQTKDAIDEIIKILSFEDVSLIEFLSKLNPDEIHYYSRIIESLLELKSPELIQDVCSSFKQSNLESVLSVNIDKLYKKKTHELWFHSFKNSFGKPISFSVVLTPNELIDCYANKVNLCYDLDLTEKYVRIGSILCELKIVSGFNKGGNSDLFDHLFSAEPWQYNEVIEHLTVAGFTFDSNTEKLNQVYQLIDSSGLCGYESALLSEIKENSDELIESEVYKEKEDLQSQFEQDFASLEKNYESKISELEEVISEKDYQIDELEYKLSLSE